MKLGRKGQLLAVAGVALAPSGAAAFEVNLKSFTCSQMTWDITLTMFERANAQGVSFFIGKPYDVPIFRQDTPMSSIAFDASTGTKATLNFDISKQVAGTTGQQSIGVSDAFSCLKETPALTPTLVFLFRALCFRSRIPSKRILKIGTFLTTQTIPARTHAKWSTRPSTVPA